MREPLRIADPSIRSSSYANLESDIRILVDVTCDYYNQATSNLSYSSIQLAVEARQHGLTSNNIPPETVIELVYQLYDVSKKESIPLEHYTFFFKHVLF